MFYYSFERQFQGNPFCLKLCARPHDSARSETHSILIDCIITFNSRHKESFSFIATKQGSEVVLKTKRNKEFKLHYYLKDIAKQPMVNLFFILNALNFFAQELFAYHCIQRF